MKSRSGAQNHALYDTARGATFDLTSDSAAAQTTQATGLTTFGSIGFSIGSLAKINTSAVTYTSWTFRKQPKFFDIVTYTGTGANRTIAHNLGSTPGCIIVKRTDAPRDWQVYHSGLTSAAYSIQLNLTSAQASDTFVWNSTAPTSSVFSVGTSNDVNASGGTYVAYIYASNAGGFGTAGTDNVISCGSFTVSSGTGSTDVNLGYEPQWLLAKPSTDPGFATDWYLYDTMRGWVNTTDGGNVNRRLNPNLYIQETTDKIFQPTATGFTMLNNNVYPGVPITYIYVAIRRGPMKTPTSGTSVFAPIATTDTLGTTEATNFPIDAQFAAERSAGFSNKTQIFDRLRGVNSTTSAAASPYLTTSNTNAEVSGSGWTQGFNNTGFQIAGNWSGNSMAYWNFRRAPGFFDEVCYTGTSPGSGSYAINHNLGVAPELIIYRQRNGASNWQAGTNFTSTNWRSMFLNFTNAGSQTTYATNDWFAAQPTSTTFTVGWGYYTTGTWVAYLFATCPGVSKVGSYTGTGATQTIDCGFTGGARFVLIKRTDSTGDWYVWDTARGMVSGTDPSLLLNSTAAEVNANSVYTATTGFQIVSTAAGINASGGTYIFLAIA